MEDFMGIVMSFGLVALLVKSMVGGIKRGDFDWGANGYVSDDVEVEIDDEEVYKPSTRRTVKKPTSYARKVKVNNYR